MPARRQTFDELCNFPGRGTQIKRIEKSEWGKAQAIVACRLWFAFCLSSDFSPAAPGKSRRLRLIVCVNAAPIFYAHKCAGSRQAEADQQKRLHFPLKFIVFACRLPFLCPGIFSAVSSFSSTDIAHTPRCSQPTQKPNWAKAAVHIIFSFPVLALSEPKR